jgi:2-alkenal reductase
VALRLSVLALMAGITGAFIALALVAVFDWFESPDRVVPITIQAPPEGPRSASAAEAGAFDPVALYRERSPGVVTIHATFDEDGDTQSLAQGSGFIVSTDGHILTNSHVITTAGLTANPRDVVAADDVFVEFVDGERVPAEIIGWDIFTDVGVLVVDVPATRLQALPLGVSDAVQVGERVAAIGSPFGQASSLTVGVVSAIGRSVASLTSDYDLIGAIQIDAPINRGNSGGPLFNARGEVIGMNAQIRSESGTSEGVGFAIAIDTALRSMEQLVESGVVQYPWIGTCTASLVPTVATQLGYTVERGALITTVFAQTPAHASGLREGTGEELVDGIRYSVGSDVVTAVDSREIVSAESLIRELSLRRPGDTVDLKVQRGPETLTLELTIGERPASAPGLC